MVQVNINYVANKNSRKRCNSRSIVTGEWIPEDSIRIDYVFATPTKKKPSCNDDCDRTPTTAPTTDSPTKINFNNEGKVDSIEFSFESDEWSISTLGESIFDDAVPRRRTPLNTSNILCGSF